MAHIEAIRRLVATNRDDNLREKGSSERVIRELHTRSIIYVQMQPLTNYFLCFAA